MAIVSTGVRFALLVLMLSTQSACFGHVRPSEASPQRLDKIRAKPKPIRVTLDNGRRVVFKEPWIRGDSILEGHKHRRNNGVSIEQVTKIEDREFQQWRTGFLIGIPTTLVALYALLLIMIPHGVVPS